MSAHKGYGQTWWGAQWLNSLSQIDYDNRLPRGRCYANKGSVTKIEIQQGNIHAKVKGSRPQPYTVKIEVPAMPQQQAKVLLDDLWWNPAVEAQATDRAYRIGQQHNVQVHRLITRATFEERINDMIQSKRNLADMTVCSGEKWIGNLSNDLVK